MEKLDKLGINNAPPSPKNTKPILAEDYNKLVNKINELYSEIKSLYVPYNGATSDIDLNTKGIKLTEDLLITVGVNKTLVLSEPTYRDEYPNELIPSSGAAAPDIIGINIGGVQRSIRGFDGGNTQEVLSGSFEIPHDYKVGDSIEVHTHWRPSTIDIGTVTWYFDWEYSPPFGEPIPQTTLYATHNIVENNQYYHILTSLGLLPQPTTPFSLGGKIGFNIRRTPSTDTYPSDVLLEQIALHIPCDTAGSRQIYIK